MFKADKKSKPARKPGGGAALMQQVNAHAFIFLSFELSRYHSSLKMGFQIPNHDGSRTGGTVDDDDSDGDLEAELRRLQSDAGVRHGSRTSKATARMLIINLIAMKSFECRSLLDNRQGDLQSLHANVNKILHDIDQPMNDDDDVSDVDEDDLLVCCSCSSLIINIVRYDRLN
jgi:hypothetical protein